MTSMDDLDCELEKLRTVVSEYYDTVVNEPAIETVSKDILGQARIASLIALVRTITRLVQTDGLTFDKDYLRALSKDEIDKHIESLNAAIESNESGYVEINDKMRKSIEFLQDASSRQYLLPYFVRETHWISVSLLSASYISSLVLMRAYFELIIGIATRETGMMNDRILSLPELSMEEKKSLQLLWYRLCAWGHPYGKWFKEVCPIYLSHKPLYHSRLFNLCLKEFVHLVDFFSVVVINKYGLSLAVVRLELAKAKIDVGEFELLYPRLNA